MTSKGYNKEHISRIFRKKKKTVYIPRGSCVKCNKKFPKDEMRGPVCKTCFDTIHNRNKVKEEFNESQG